MFEASVDTLPSQVGENLESVFHVIQTVLPPMLDAGSGQVLVVTSAAGAKPVVQAPIYSATRAEANMLIKATALLIADQGVILSAVGTNYLDYPQFWAATGADHPEIRAELESQVPMRWLGATDEVA